MSSDDDELVDSRPVNFTGGVEVDGKTRFGVDAEAALELESKRDPAFEQHLLEFVCDVLGRPRLPADTQFSASFVDGVLLTELANAIKPGCCAVATSRTLSGSSGGVRALTSISGYLHACKEHFGLRPAELISPADVANGVNAVGLQRHLAALARHVKTLPQFANVHYRGPARVQAARSWSFRDAQAQKQAEFERAKAAGFREPVRIWQRPLDLLLFLLQLLVIVRVAVSLNAFACGQGADVSFLSPAAPVAPAAAPALTPSAEGSWFFNAFFPRQEEAETVAAKPLEPPPPPERADWLEQTCDAVDQLPLAARIRAVLSPDHLSDPRAQKIANIADLLIETALASVAMAGSVCILVGVQRWRRPAMVQSIFYLSAVLPKLLLIECLQLWLGELDVDDAARLVFLLVFAALLAFQLRRFARDQQPFTRRMVQWNKKQKTS
jgi:hypothetical protein